ncbi:Hypothetical protein GLP15_4725 [Giardia lamblia P15]|uniref:Uncharacterized protein n=1 Tax=Giardia intestinalis (strain P15) TaxID=658858 RepID=E1F1N3_GIAIA|nr:Hypothetical protein GLP15_4725 [Giardia lamblia P15]
MNGAGVMRRLMVVASVQHVGKSTRIPLVQTTLIHAIVVGVQGAMIKSLTFDCNFTKRALPYFSVLPGEYLVDHVIPYNEVVPESESVLQIDLGYPEDCPDDIGDNNYVLVYGISFDLHNLSPLGKFLPEIVSLLFYYETESGRASYKFEHPLLFTLYSAGYAACYGRKYLMADSYFKRLAENLGNTLLIQQQKQDKQRLDIATVHVLTSLSVTRLIAVVDLNKHEKTYEAAVRFYDTLQWFFLTLLSWYVQITGNSSVSETRMRLFAEHYTHLTETLHSVTIQARHLVSLETCFLPCIYDLLFLLILDTAKDFTSAQLLELINAYSPNSSTALSMLCTNTKQLIDFSRSRTIFDTPEKTSAIIYMLDLVLQSSMLSLQPEMLKLIVTPFVLQLTSSSTEQHALTGQALMVLQTVRDRLPCLSPTSLFRFFVDLFGLCDPVVLLQIADSEEGQFLYTLVIDILDIFSTARLAIDFHSFFPSSQQSDGHNPKDIKTYWDLERYIKSLSYLTEVTIIIVRQIRHTYIYFHTINRKYNKLLGADKDTLTQTQQTEVLTSLKEKYHLSAKEIETLLAFRKDSLSPLQTQLTLAIKLNTLLGNTFGTVLLCSQSQRIVPCDELVSSLNSYLYKCSACIGLVLCNLDEIPIRGVPVREQAVYARASLAKQPHDVHDIAVLAPLLIDFKLSELVESKMLVYKPLSTDIFKYPNLSNAILHVLGNFFAGFGFCVSVAASLPLSGNLHAHNVSKMIVTTPTARGDTRLNAKIRESPLSSSTTSPCQQEYGRGKMPPQLTTDVATMNYSTNSNASTEQEPYNAYLSLIRYYYLESSPDLPFLKPITIFLNTLFASGIILGNRIAHRSKEERVYHCSLSISDLGLEKLTSTELYSLAENIWYFVRYYSNSLFQCTTYSDLLFGAYMLEFIRFSRFNSLNEVLLCQFINYSQLYWSDSLASAEPLVVKSLEPCFPTFILLDLPSARETSEPHKSIQLSVQKVLNWFQTIGFSASKFYLLTELLYLSMQQILRHSKYQMFPECYGLIGKMLHLVEALLDRLYELDSNTVEAYTYTKHYVEILYRLTTKVAVHLSIHFIPSTHFYREAARDAASLLVSTPCLKYYNDTLFLLITNQSRSNTATNSDFHLSITFIANLLELVLLYNLSDDVTKSRVANCQLLKLVMLSWKHLKRNAFLNGTNICTFARICALLTLFELIIFPSCKDAPTQDTSFSVLTELHEYVTLPLFFLAYAKELVGKYSLLLNEWFTKWSDTNVVMSEARLKKLLDIFIVAVKPMGCARIHLYASAFIQKLLSTVHICKLLSHREQQELRTFCATAGVHACCWDTGELDYENQSATALLTELETPISKKPEYSAQLDEVLLSTELLSVPSPKSLSDISIIPLISNGNLQEMRPRHIPQTELPHYSSIVDLKLSVATQYAIVFSFTVPFVGTKETNMLLDLPISADTDESVPDTFMDKIDGLMEGTFNKKVKLLMGHDMPSYSIKTPLGEHVERRYNVIYSKRLLELVPNEFYSLTDGDASDATITLSTSSSSKVPVVKTNELTRRYMSKEERNRRAQYLLQNALDEFADENLSTARCEPLQEEDLSSAVVTKSDHIANNLRGKLVRISTDSDGHDDKVQDNLEVALCTHVNEDCTATKECLTTEFSGDDNEYVDFNIDDDTIEGQLPDSIIQALHQS